VSGAGALGTAALSRSRTTDTAVAPAPTPDDAEYVTVPVDEPAVTVHVPEYISASLPWVVVETGSQVTADNVQPATVTDWDVWVIRSLLITTARARVSPAAISPAATEPVALTVATVSSVSVRVVPIALNSPEVNPNRSPRPIVGDPLVTVNVAEPAAVELAVATNEVARTDPVSAPFATEPEVPVDSCVHVPSGAVGVEENGLLPIISRIASPTAPASQSGVAVVVPAPDDVPGPR
jgi:hypothetical protein